MTRPMSELVDPAVKSDRIKRSIDTDGSPASILATRDWLDLMRRASAACERFLFNRRRLSSRAKETRTSTKAASASVRPRNSLASATFQPARWSFSFLSFRISTSSTSLDYIVSLQAVLAPVDDRLWRLPRFLGEHLQNDYGVRIDPKDNAPRYAFVVDPQFSASRSDLGQCLATWHPEVLPLLQHPEQESCFPPGRIGKWRALDLSVQPDKRFILIWHRSKLCHI